VTDETMRRVELAHRYAVLEHMRRYYGEAGRDRSCSCCTASPSLIGEMYWWRREEDGEMVLWRSSKRTAR